MRTDPRRGVRAEAATKAASKLPLVARPTPVTLGKRTATHTAAPPVSAVSSFYTRQIHFSAPVSIDQISTELNKPQVFKNSS